MSRLETVRTKDEVISQQEISKTKVPRGTWPDTQVYLSKAKLGYLKWIAGPIYIFWDRGTVSHSGVDMRESTWVCEKWVKGSKVMRTLYTDVRKMSQKKYGHENIVHRCKRKWRKRVWTVTSILPLQSVWKIWTSRAPLQSHGHQEQTPGLLFFLDIYLSATSLPHIYSILVCFVKA